VIFRKFIVNLELPERQRCVYVCSKAAELMEDSDMKKFLVLALVLSIASMASAVTVTLTTSDKSLSSGTISFNVTSGGDMGMALVVDGGTLASFAPVPANCGTANYMMGLYSDMPDPLLNGAAGGEAWVLASNPGEVIHDGSWLTASWTRTTPIWATAYYVDAETGMVIGEKAAEVYIPEPATICLLGLGGLALLRRRK
jgi:hypothetical protein